MELIAYVCLIFSGLWELAKLMNVRSLTKFAYETLPALSERMNKEKPPSKLRKEDHVNVVFALMLLVLELIEASTVLLAAFIVPAPFKWILLATCFLGFVTYWIGKSGILGKGFLTWKAADYAFCIGVYLIGPLVLLP